MLSVFKYKVFKSWVIGPIKKGPDLKLISNTKCCNFTLSVANIYKDKKIRSNVRCTVWGALAEQMLKEYENGDIVVGFGDASIIPYKEKYVYNLTITSLKIIKIGEKNE